MKPPFCFLAVVLPLLGGCVKDDPETGLPPATKVGANTGGCLINGERFVANGWDSGGILSNPIPPLDGGFAFDSLYRLEIAGKQGGNNVYLSLFLKRVGRTPPRLGVYRFHENTPYYPQGGAAFVLNHATYRIAGATGGETYVTDSRDNGQVNLIYADYRQGISAGTFEFTAASTFDRSKTVTVTSGRFDRKQ